MLGRAKYREPGKCMPNIAKQGHKEELRRTTNKLHATTYKPFPGALYIASSSPNDA